MAGKSQVFTYLQAICTVLALLLNSLLIYVARKNSKSGIGAYKYVLITFAIFEMVYALIVLIGMPINYIAEKQWIVFNHDGIIGRTSFNWLGPALYCTFYELWMGLVVVHFIYRYIVVCRMELRQKIEDTVRYKVILALIYTIHVFYAFACGFYYCTRNPISDLLLGRIHDDFGIEDPQSVGYIIARIKTLEGDISPGGTIAILNHYTIVSISVVIIGFCGINIWFTIRRMAKESSQIKNVNLQRQMFFTLLIQTTIPFFLCHLPTLVYLVGTSPFMPDGFSFGAISSIFSILTAIPKILDPIVVMICIREYRHATVKILGCGKRARIVGFISSTSEDYLKRTGETQTHSASDRKRVESTVAEEKKSGGEGEMAIRLS